MLKRVVRVLLLQCLVATLFTGCGADPDDLPAHGTVDVPCPWDDPEDLLAKSLADFEGMNRALSVEEMHQDLACLAELFEKQYAAAPFYEGEGISLRARVREAIAGIDLPLYPAEFTDRLLALHEGAYDSHVSYGFRTAEENLRRFMFRYQIYVSSVLFRKEGEDYLSVPVDGQEEEVVTVRECAAMHPLPALPSGGEERFVFVGQFPEGAPPGERLECRDPEGAPVAVEVGRKELETLPQDLREFFFTILEGGILYVRMPQMPPVLTDRHRMLHALLSFPFFSLPVLFDLRQNPGGSDGFAWNEAEAIHSTAQRFGAISTQSMISLYSMASTTNQVFYAWKKLEEMGDPRADEYATLYDEWLSRFQGLLTDGYGLDDLTLEPAESEGMFGTREFEYGKPIVLLVDKGCASACESWVSLFRDLANVKVLGTHTMGAYRFGNVGTSVLPRSRVVFYGGWKEFQRKISPVEGLGFEPDFFIVEGDMLQVAEEYLRDLLTDTAAE